VTAPFSKYIRICFWIASITLGAAQAWTSRFIIVNDVISYLDMGSNFFQGHKGAIINGVWSPFYAFLLGAILTAFRPSLYWEYPLVHLLVFFIFLLTLACFEFFLHQFALLREDCISDSGIVDWSYLVVAYVTFLWASLSLIGVYETNPDMLIAALFYLSCGLLIRIHKRKASWKTFVGLGFILGVGYLTKAAMLPISLILLATAWLIADRRARKRALISVSVFILTVAPYVAALSFQKGHLSLGESGKYNYAVHVDGVPLHHWQGGGGGGIAAHPTREIVTVPATFEFKQPILGTYPAWFDPSYWYTGVRAHFSVKKQVIAAAKNIFHQFATIFYALDGALFVSLFIVLYQGNKGQILKNITRCWFLIVPSILCVGLYTLVHHEARYIAPFFAVLCISFFSCALWADGSSNPRLFSGAAVIQVVALLWTLAVPTLVSLPHPWAPEKGLYQDVAQGAQQLGLSPGDQIASLDFSNLGMAMWAHLARARIVAEVYYWPGGPEGSTKSFWDVDPETQDKVLQQFSEIGAKAVVSSDLPAGPGADRWLQIGKTGYYLLWLNRVAVAAQSRVP
jgi:hypothetical protein